MRVPGICLTSLVFLTALPGVALASAPPPPPPYVFSASRVLADAAVKEQAKVAEFFADDVIASTNGQQVASGKAAWLKWWGSDRSHHFGMTLGYSMRWMQNGALLVLDQFDRQDYSADPWPTGDPRPSTRSTLYRFGPDGLIHSVNISEVNSFYTVAK